MQPMNPTPGAAPKDNKSMMMFIIIVIVVVLVLLGVFALPKLMDEKVSNVDLDENAYYAVFLTNGQVYFGHLDYNKMPTLTDIYYLQVKQGETSAAVQPAGEEGDAEAQPTVQDQSEAQPELTLVKLGKELHGPEDMMTLNYDHILFYEKLTEESNVVKAINEDKDKE